MKKFSLPQKAKKQLKKLGIVAVYLFGSRAQGVAGPLSDYDFGMLMSKYNSENHGKLYDAVYDILSPVCPRTLKNDVIDIVFLNNENVSLELKMHVIRYGLLLLDEDPQRRVNFEERVMLEYCDFRPMLDMMDKTILASL